MDGKHSIILKFAVVFTSLFATTFACAQTPATQPPQAVGSNNMLVYLLVTMAAVLAFVIYGLAQALLVLSKKVVEAGKSSITAVTTTLLVGLLLLSQAGTAQVAAEPVKVIPNYGGLSETTFYVFLTVLSIEVITIFFLFYAVRSMYLALLPQKALVVVAVNAKSKWWTSLKKILTRATPVEREADVMLDHDYDGIRELDNALPPWWKYGFYLTIAVAFFYILNFHVFGTGKNPTEEYNEEMAKAGVEKEIYEANNKDKIDENNVPLANAAGIAEAKTIFSTTCVACHGKEGGGGAGPNLTDNYWLHKGSLNDVYHTIKNGYPDKGMQAWSAVFSPKEMSFLASYIKSLHGTNPADAKAPQGDLFQELLPGSKSPDSPGGIKKDSLIVRKIVASNEQGN